MPKAVTTSVSLIDYRLDSIFTVSTLKEDVSLNKNGFYKNPSSTVAVFQKSVNCFKNPFCGKQYLFPLVTRENRYT